MVKPWDNPISFIKEMKINAEPSEVRFFNEWSKITGYLDKVRESNPDLSEEELFVKARDIFKYSNYLKWEKLKDKYIDRALITMTGAPLSNEEKEKLIAYYTGTPDRIRYNDVIRFWIFEDKYLIVLEHAPQIIKCDNRILCQFRFSHRK